jgi:hypothetical protein
MTNETTIKKIKELESDNALKNYVIDYILNEDEPLIFIKDLLNNGCQSGMVTELVYYRDTQKFYNKFYNEIEELRREYEAGTGQPLEIEGDLKNWLAWFGFEQMVYEIAGEAGLDI